MQTRRFTKFFLFFGSFEMPKDELTKSQLEQQDRVDNSIKALLLDLGLAEKGIIETDWWDIQAISRIRASIETSLNMTEPEKFEFYPWIPEAQPNQPLSWVFRMEQKLLPILPPKCPECKEPLKGVEYVSYERYNFHEDGSYDEEKWGGDVDIKCPSCNADVSDVFPDGPMNWTPI
jgi:hypothetical protein